MPEPGLRIATRTAYRDADDKPVYTETGTIPDEESYALTVFGRTDLAYDGRRNAVREAVSSAGTTRSVAERSFDDRGQLRVQHGLALARQHVQALDPVGGAFA